MTEVDLTVALFALFFLCFVVLVIINEANIATYERRRYRSLADLYTGIHAEMKLKIIELEREIERLRCEHTRK